MFYKFKPIYWMVLIGLILSLLPQGSYAQDTTTEVPKVYLPLITSQVGTTQPAPDVYTFVPTWLDVNAVNAANATTACGNKVPVFNPNVAAAEVLTTTTPNDDICLLPDNYPGVDIRKNGVSQSFVVGGWQGTNRTAWNITGAQAGAITKVNADVVHINNWPKERGIPTLPAGAVSYIEIATPQAMVAAQLLTPNVTQIELMEFLENLLQHRDDTGVVGFNVAFNQPFVDSTGVGSKTPGVCGASADDGADVTLAAPTTLPSTGFSAKLAIKVSFSDPAMHTCMAPYHYLPLIDLLTVAKYEPLRQAMRDSGNNSWEQFKQWTILRPDPDTIYTLAWIATTAGGIWTVAKYKVVAGGTYALEFTNSILIVPTRFIECAGLDPRICEVTIQ